VDLSSSLLEISLLLAGAVVIGIAAKRWRIPVTVLLAVAGFTIAWAGGDELLPVVEELKGEEFEDIVVNIFLPVLVFEAALSLSTRHFLRNLGPILLLATAALAIAAGIVGYALHYFLNIPLAAALLFGVLISATDPVAVVAVFRDLGVSKRLLTIVEGESLLNDGVAIVGFNILLGAALGSRVSIASGLLEFVGVFVGGAAAGAAIGLVAALVLPLIDRLSAATLSLGVAYGSFVLGEDLLGVSGIVATLTAGLVIGGFAPSRASEEVRQTLDHLWESLAYIANGLLFLFIGLLIDPEGISQHLDAIVVATIAVLIARPLAIVPLVAALERFGGIRKVGSHNTGVLVWGGLRGGAALALALALPNNLILQDRFIVMTGAVVMMTLLLNATTISTLVHRLGLDRPTRKEQFLEASARLLAVREARERLAELGYRDQVVDARLRVAEVEAQELIKIVDLDADEELQVYTLRGLYAERRVYQTLSDAGLLRPIATRTLMQEIDDELEEIGAGHLEVDAARRGRRAWYKQVVRKLLAWLPEPAGENITEVEYSEVSARRLAAQRACDQLERLKELPNCDTSVLDKAKETFAYWEQSATTALSRLDTQSDIDNVLLARRHAEALARIAAVESVVHLVDAGLMSQRSADAAVKRIVEEVNRSHE
jgi:CPA1 family monovalent cation:H+ antiporter